MPGWSNNGSSTATPTTTGCRRSGGTRPKPDWARSLNSSEIDTLADDLELKISRGYSDHEHLDRARFVHMNGRVYDPRTGRFLSPDPVVENPAFSQRWNSYSHDANSPLSLVDPTGRSNAPCRIPAPDFSCNPIGSPGGGCGGAIQTIVSNIHRVRFEVFVYKTLVFGSTGDIPGDRECVFDVLSVIRVFVSVGSETVEREVPVDDQNEAEDSRVRLWLRTATAVRSPSGPSPMPASRCVKRLGTLVDGGAIWSHRLWDRSERRPPQHSPFADQTDIGAGHGIANEAVLREDTNARQLVVVVGVKLHDPIGAEIEEHGARALKLVLVRIRTNL